jgi:methionyl-tRNA synthetase
MKELIFIGVAWPYANGSLHLGHMAGCYLPADIFARFCRMNNKNVLMVSGSDEHGTPITITAENENTTPKNIVDRFNKEHTENMKIFGISFDLFTRTTTDNHKEVVQDIFKVLYDKKYIYKKGVESYYCKNCNRFLPDRYIEGTCHNCHYESARGDQCDECGNIHDPQELLEVRCKICGNTPEIRSSDHLFFALSKFESKLIKWIGDKKHWKSSVYKFTKNWLNEGLKDRAITRDMSWGINVPIKGFEDKRIYVWFDAVIGYYSASKEWSNKFSDSNQWLDWWKDKNAKHFYFLAKDNIPFHTLIWPSILMGYDESLNLPYNVPANEYLKIKGEQFSKSKGLGIWVPEILKKFNVDSVRYYLSINMPENKDTNWSWEDFITKNNDELVGTYGNFIHRVFTFAHKNFGKIPKSYKLDDLDKETLNKIKEKSTEIKESINLCNFKKGLRSAMHLAQHGNYYFDQKKPWMLIKTDKQKCSTTLNICFNIVNALAIYMAPYLPFSSQKIWKMLGNNTNISDIKWDDAISKINVDFDLEKPKTLFDKLSIEDYMAEEDLFSNVELRTAKIIDAKEHPDAEKLLILEIEMGKFGQRVIVAGIKNHYSIEELIGKNIVIVANLKPAKIRGIKSNGMLLAATDSEGIVSLLNPNNAPPGSRIFIEGISYKPDNIIEFEKFQQIKMQVDEKQQIVYKNKILKSETGTVKSDKPVKSGSPIS